MQSLKVMFDWEDITAEGCRIHAIFLAHKWATKKYRNVLGINLEMNSFQIPIAILLLVGHLPPRKTISYPS